MKEFRGALADQDSDLTANICLSGRACRDRRRARQ
jgi:hypothetical protein